MNTFPDVDFPLWGNVPLEEKETTGDPASSKFKTYNNVDAKNPPFTLGTVFSDIGDVVATPFRKIGDTVRNTYFYLIAGIAVVGIVAIFVLGAASKLQRG